MLFVGAVRGDRWRLRDLRTARAEPAVSEVCDVEGGIFVVSARSTDDGDDDCGTSSMGDGR